MISKLLYLGDTSLKGAASYLSGIMTHSQILFDYKASNDVFCDNWLENDYAGLIISDYPASNFSDKHLLMLAGRIKNGLGLLMIGGWQSYVGMGGNYHKTVLADCLPVLMGESDDRMNLSSPCVVSCSSGHQIVDGLPFETDTPVVGGFNAVEPKPGATTILDVNVYKTIMRDNTLKFDKIKTYPLLVIGKYGAGNVAAFTSDVAPHWVGGPVDWGKGRIKAQAKGANLVEMGETYVELFTRIIRWVSKDK